MIKIRKILSVFALVTMLFTHNMGYATVALALPDLPDSTDTTDEPDTTDETDVPDAPDNDHEEEVEEEEEVVDASPSPTATPTASPSPENEDIEEDEEYDYKDVQEAPKAPGVNTGNTGNNNNDGGMGDNEIDTGNAQASGTINNLGNTNVSENDGDGVGGITILNKDNGAESENTGTVVLEDNSLTDQNNNANLDNSLTVDSNSGENSSSKNTGGDSNIDTGHATSTGTILNSVNTNMAGAAVSEFNVNDGHEGDLILDFEAGCISGCGLFDDINLANMGNGSDSVNSTELELLETDATFQNNDADVENELVLNANTGENTADKNTGGDSSIDTGDATVVGNVLNFLNNNIAGNVIYGVVNIFDNFVGDIIIPEKYADSYSSQTIDIANVGNGSGSENSGEVLLSSTEQFTQFNDADIVNNLIIDANTGENETSANTGGDSSIDTGDVNVDAQILNIANNNVVGGDWWIVLINQAGNWFGQIFTPEGAMNGGFFAMGSGTDAEVNSNGDITVTNEGNGSDSTNEASALKSVETETVQTNNAKITNNIELTANTGNNSASKNTGGDSSIDTGDANVQFNLVNFVNNNFAGGNVFLTVVNVFGDWFGDFLTPGQAKAQDNNDDNSDNQSGVGGNSNLLNNGDNNSSGGSNSSSSNDNSNNSSAGSSDTGQVLAATQVWQTPASSNSLTNGKIAGGASDTLAQADTTQNIAEDIEEKTRINLAWLLLAIPAYFTVRIVRRRFLGA